MTQLQAFIGLGSNLGDRAAQIRDAVERLDVALGGLATSRWYETTPVGPVQQPDFLNMVIRSRVGMEPRRLLGLCQGIERALGRDRSQPHAVRFGPRRIDLDILAIGTVQVRSPELTIPHPRLQERAFVLIPWSDIDPSFVPPGLATPISGLVADLAPSASDGVTAIAPPIASERRSD